MFFKSFTWVLTLSIALLAAASNSLLVTANILKIVAANRRSKADVAAQQEAESEVAAAAEAKKAISAVQELLINLFDSIEAES